MVNSIWEHVGAAYAWVRRNDVRISLTSKEASLLRLLKVTEEQGEAAQAAIGVEGQNPRKGVTHTNADVASELCDVAISALVALHDYVPNPEDFMTEYIKARGVRLT